MAQVLRVRHDPNSDPPQFEVEDADSGRRTPKAVVPSPAGFPVEGRPASNLLAELRWYLETFLDYPFPPETDHAERVLAALRAWGTQAFKALFGSREGGDMLHDARKGGYENLLLQIWSDDPRVLAWPWEALSDPSASMLAHSCRIERRLNQNILNTGPLSPSLPKDHVHILLVIARPLKEDVKYRSIARPLVDLIEEQGLPARVHVLRPPTIDSLRAYLRDRPSSVHLIHFDGHGGYGEAPIAGAPYTPIAGAPYTLAAAQGHLLFEDANGEPDPIKASTLSALLQEHRIPAMVLNACQSAMLDKRADDPFASVAASLLKAGTRSVVAMSYALHVSGAREFLPAFYTRLFETGSIADAARAGRQKMLEKPGRICARGRYDLHDWIVPVVYQQDALELRFDRKGGADGGAPPSQSKKLPEEALDGRNPYGLIGRDGPILELERAMRRPVAGILIHGLGGVGKTTLARGFVEWLAATGGLGAGCIWLSFQEMRSAEAVINRMGERLFGPNFTAAGADEKLDALVGALKQTSVLIVWDNFESVAGLPPAVPATMPETDRRVLRSLLERLRGGKTKVLITSRSEEDWLGPEQRRKVPLGGLDGEERWAYAEAMLRDLGVPVRRDDAKLVELMDLLGGHPLAMRVVLPRLERRTAGDLVTALRSNVATLGDGGEEAETKLYATLKLAEDALPEELKGLLLPLGMHERYVDGDYLEVMAKKVDEAWTRERIDRFLGLQVNAGLLRDEGQSVYEMHPALSGFLRSKVVQGASGEARDVWSRAFVDVMGSVADAHAPRQLHEKRAWFHWHGANSYHALVEAERLAMSAIQAALLQGLGVYAHNVRGFDEARALYERLAEAWKAAGDAKGEAGAYHQLGMVAQEQRDFSAAEAWYRKSLAINEKQGNEHGAAPTYHQLGRVAQEQRDFSAAEAWYRKSLAIKEKQRNDHGAANTYHQLGRVAQEQQDFSAAEAWYRKSLAITEKPGNEHVAARTYHQLGIIAQERQDFSAAEGWYRKSLAIEEKQGNEHGAAQTYHQLGTVAQEQQDFSAAEAWYRKALAIEEKQGNEHSAAGTYGQLGIAAALQGHFEDAGRWLVKSIASFARSRDPEGAERNMRNFLRSFQRAPAAEQAKLKAIWQDAGLDELPENPTPAEST